MYTKKPMQAPTCIADLPPIPSREGPPPAVPTGGWMRPSETIVRVSTNGSNTWVWRTAGSEQMWVNHKEDWGEASINQPSVCFTVHLSFEGLRHERGVG